MIRALRWDSPLVSGSGISNNVMYFCQKNQVMDTAALTRTLLENLRDSLEARPA